MTTFDLPGSGPADGPGIPHLTITTPTDILATIPYLVGRPPEPGMVVLGVRGEAVLLALSCDLARGDTSYPGVLGERAVQALLRERCRTALAVGYGTAAVVTPHMDALRAAAVAGGVRVDEALRMTEGRYWSYVCASPRCCPPEGVRYDPDASLVPATAVAHGLSGAPPDRFGLAPVQGRVRDQVARAAARLAGRAERLRAARHPNGRDDFGAEFRTEGGRAVRRAIAAAEKGCLPDDPDTLAWLGIVLTSVRVRDEAWARIRRPSASVHADLWRHVMRHVPDRHRAAPGALLAVAAWLLEDEPLARAALAAVLEADPAYSMALLLRQVLATGVPLEKWTDLTPEWLEREWPLDAP